MHFAAPVMLILTGPGNILHWPSHSAKVSSAKSFSMLGRTLLAPALIWIRWGLTSPWNHYGNKSMCIPSTASNKHNEGQGSEWNVTHSKCVSAAFLEEVNQNQFSFRFLHWFYKARPSQHLCWFWFFLIWWLWQNTNALGGFKRRVRCQCLSFRGFHFTYCQLCCVV